MINGLVVGTLKPLGVPVSFSRYAGTAPTYITFFCYNEQGETWAENLETATGYYVQVDIWSKGDSIILADQVRKAMENAGFIRTTAQDMPYEPETGIYHKAIRFSYVI